MTDQQTAPLTDARFLGVLRHVADTAVDATGEGRNGELWLERESVGPWLDEQVGNALRSPGDQLRAMLEARARFGQNIRLIEDIDVERLRRVRPRLLEREGDQLDALLDFVDEVRKIAKEI
jgi:hypothetical protein